MKSTKKLFAILTLMMFMMTLLPMAAFGAAVTAYTRTSAATTAAGSAYAFVADVTPATTLVAGDTITVTLPSRITIANTAALTALNAASVNLVVKTNTSTLSSITAATTWGAASNVVTLSLTGADTIIAGDVITVTVNTTASTTFGAAQDVSLATSKDTTADVESVEVIPATKNRFTSTIAQDKTTVDANNSDTIKFTIFVYDQYYNPMPLGTKVFFASSRGSTDDFSASGFGYAAATAEGGGAQANVYEVASTDATGKVEIKVRSLVAGTATIGFSLYVDDVANAATNNSIYDYLTGKSGVLVDGLGLLATKTAEFKAEAANNVNLFDVTLRNRTAASSFAAGTNVSGEYIPTANLGTTWGKANELDYYEISVKVSNTQGAPAADQTVNFSVDKVDAFFSSATATTDGSGVAKVKVYAKKAGLYTITYKTGSATPKTIKVNFDAADVSKITLKSDDNRTLAKNTIPNWKFEVQDSLGNKIDITTNAAAVAAISTIDALTQPSGADYKLSTFTITADTDNNWIKVVPNSAFTKEGAYRLRFTLANGQYAEVNFTIKEQGTITALKMKYPQTSLPMNTLSGTPTVTWVDAAGVEKDATNTAFSTDGIQFSCSDYNKTGAINAATGVFTSTNTKDFIGDAVITAYDNANKLTASFTITIGRQLSTMIVTAPAEKVEVGATASIPVKFIDVEGKDVAVGNKVVTLVNAYAVTKPEGATVSVEAATAFGKNIKEKGVSALEVKSNTAGDATIFVNVSVGADNYTSTFNISFGAPKQVIGAKQVTMFIGATGFTKDGAPGVTDVAPFIQDGRTFVAVRPVADAFGAEIGWDEATQTVTLTRSDITVTIVIGSNTITVVQDGVTSTVTADVAAMIKDGRTVLPFRAVGEAFGATVNYDAATQSVSYQQ